jgi:hypothetical protein
MPLNGTNTQTPPDEEAEDRQHIDPDNDGEDNPLEEEQWDTIPSSDGFQLGGQYDHPIQTPRPGRQHKH